MHLIIDGMRRLVSIGVPPLARLCELLARLRGQLDSGHVQE
ncbi:hypothetical protein [Enhygromyxa salina]|nr:hypothetical protein [Enhygromyxa salina]